MMKLLLGKPARLTGLAVAAAVLLAIPVVAQIQFRDVPDDNPHRADILTVAGNRWFVGYSDGSYKPDRKISASEMTRVLTRAFPEGITRAEFASFIVAGNEWKNKVKTVTTGINGWDVNSGVTTRLRRWDGVLQYEQDPYIWRSRWYDLPIADYPRLVYGTNLYVVAYHPDDTASIWYNSDNGIRYIEPGTYQITPTRGCRWMRLNAIPDGSLNFDTVSASNAVLAGHYQGLETNAKSIVRIHHTDAAFMIEC